MFRSVCFLKYIHFICITLLLLTLHLWYVDMDDGAAEYYLLHNTYISPKAFNHLPVEWQVSFVTVKINQLSFLEPSVSAA
jgi:hypothetical protein